MKRAATAVLPLASYSRRNTITTRCVAAASMARSRAEGGDDTEAAIVVVEAVAAEYHGDTRHNPLAQFDLAAYETAVGVANEFGIDEEAVKVACARVVPSSAPLHQQKQE